MTSRDAPFSSIVRPIIEGSEPYLLAQSPSLMSTTDGPSGTSSSAVGKRPRWGNAPTSSKALAVMAATLTWVGGPSFVNGHWMLPALNAPNVANERLLFTKCQ